MLAFCAGLRVSEICNLKKWNINFDKNIGTVVNGKNGSNRKFKIPDKFSKQLQKLINSRINKKCSFIFQNYKGERLSTRSV